MKIGDRIKKHRNEKGISTYELSKLTGISQSAISKLENGKRKVDFDTLDKIADALGVYLGRLTGESASSIIEDRINELDMTLAELSKKSKVPFYWLENLDTFTPGELGDYEIGYDWITKIAKLIGLSPSSLRTALARQEIPVYDGPQDPPTPEEDFKEYLVPKEESKYYTSPEAIKIAHAYDEADFKSKNIVRTVLDLKPLKQETSQELTPEKPILTIAAHKDKEEWTEENQQDVADFMKFVKDKKER